MTRVKFAKRVKFNGKFYDAYDAFDVPEEAVAQLLQQGASIVKVEENDLIFNAPFVDNIEDNDGFVDELIKEEVEKHTKRKKK